MRATCFLFSSPSLHLLRRDGCGGFGSTWSVPSSLSSCRSDFPSSFRTCSAPSNPISRGTLPRTKHCPRTPVLPIPFVKPWYDGGPLLCFSRSRVAHEHDGAARSRCDGRCLGISGSQERKGSCVLRRGISPPACIRSAMHRGESLGEGDVCLRSRAHSMHLQHRRRGLCTVPGGAQYLVRRDAREPHDA